jgi:hypothetical protein
MAILTNIKKTIEFVGIVELLAYVRITSITCTQTAITVVICCHHNNRDGIIIKSQCFVFVPNHNGKSIFSQAYDHLKTLPEFSNATDC